jgi:alkanesulfonate monooxygenase SsuD/methylene tetrahydromethanopterin reductase-like flavin-dependent oxidoreductase (luciferase family)
MGIGAAMATDLLHHAWVGERTGLDPAGALRFLEDLCPPYPRRPKLPPLWPPVPDPDPGPDWYAEYYLGFAARLAAVPGDQMAGRMREFFDKALDQSIASLEKAVG